jgi:hypothetical protein
MEITGQIRDPLNPNQDGDLEGMDELAEKWGVSAWNCYVPRVSHWQRLNPSAVVEWHRR